ncbi:unnamed protein product, partial [Brassica oleracea var. botrytis]
TFRFHSSKNKNRYSRVTEVGSTRRDQSAKVVQETNRYRFVICGCLIFFYVFVLCLCSFSI